MLAPELDGEGGGVDVADEIAYCEERLARSVSRKRGGKGMGLVGGTAGEDSRCKDWE